MRRRWPPATAAVAQVPAAGVVADLGCCGEWPPEVGVSGGPPGHPDGTRRSNPQADPQPATPRRGASRSRSLNETPPQPSRPRQSHPAPGNCWPNGWPAWAATAGNGWRACRGASWGRGTGDLQATAVVETPVTSLQTGVTGAMFRGNPQRTGVYATLGVRILRAAQVEVQHRGRGAILPHPGRAGAAGGQQRRQSLRHQHGDGPGPVALWRARRGALLARSV